VGAEGIKNGVVPEGRRVVTAQANFTEVAHQLDDSATTPEAGICSTGVSVQCALQLEACLEADAEIFNALDADFAAVDAVLAHRERAITTSVLDVATVQVDRTKQRHGGLSRCDTSESAQNC